MKHGKDVLYAWNLEKHQLQDSVLSYNNEKELTKPQSLQHLNLNKMQKEPLCLSTNVSENEITTVIWEPIPNCSTPPSKFTVMQRIPDALIH